MEHERKPNKPNELLKDDYDLTALVETKPWRDNFSILVAPRFKGIYENGYERFSTRITKNFVKKSDLFIDVGANYGYYSILAAHSNEKVDIIAIEPIEENFSALKKNITSNNIDEKDVECINAAASSAAGAIKLYKSEASDNSSIIPHPNSRTLQQIEVQAIALDQLLADDDRNKSIFVKIDTSGNELDVLKGFSETLKKVKDITMLIEINPKLLKLTNTSYAEIAGFLDKNDFMLYALDDNAFRYYPLDDTVNISMMMGLFEQTFFNILCVRKEKAMSVAFFSHSADLYGAERCLHDLISGISEIGVLCTAILPYDGPLAYSLREIGCAVYTLPQGLNQSISWWWAETGRNADELGVTKFPSTINLVQDTLLPEVKKIKPDVIFSQTIVSPWGSFISEMLDIPHAISAREYGVLDHKLKFIFDFKESMDALYKSSDAVFCVSNDVKDILFETDVDNKVDVIYSNIQINFDELSKATTSEIFAVGNNNTIKVGIFGNVVASKGQKDIVQACIELLNRDVKINCYIFGHADQGYYEEIMGIINDSGHKGSFVLPGFIENPYPLMNLMDIIVSCSAREALGRTLLEAILFNKPIIYSNSGGPKEIFTDGIHGLAYEHGNYMDLADKIEYTIANQVETQTRIKQATEHVNNIFNRQNYAGKVYSQLLKLKSEGRVSSSRGVIDLVDKYNLSSLPSKTFYPKVYFANCVDCFSENNSVYAGKLNYGLFNLVYDLPNNGYPYIRFDPLEGELIELTIYKIEFTCPQKNCSAEIMNFYSNGVTTNKNSWEFHNYDPQLIFHLNYSVKQIKMFGELKKVSPEKVIVGLNQEIEQKNHQLSAQAQEIEQKNHQLSAQAQEIVQQNQQLSAQAQEIEQKNHQLSAQAQEIEQKNREISLIINSLSWKVTAPLRKIKHLIIK